ncbi:MAG: metallophosphoesterase [Candidatus Thiodiazotropha taylori]
MSNLKHVTPLKIAVFGDTHGHLRLMFQLCRLWQLENGVHLDAILQCGDMGFYPDPNRVDKATKRFAELDPEELGFAYYFRKGVEGDVTDPLMDRILKGAPESLDTIRSPVVWCQGNHEDFQALRHTVGTRSLVPVDRYDRLYLLQPGEVATISKLDSGIAVPGFDHRIELSDKKGNYQYVFPEGSDFICTKTENAHKGTCLDIGSLGGSQEVPSAKHVTEKNGEHLKHVSQQGARRLGQESFDVLISHCAPAGVGIEYGSEWLRDSIVQAQPFYHFYAHHRDPIAPERIGGTWCYWLNDVNFVRSKSGTAHRLEAGCMGILTWKNSEEHGFDVVDDSWLENVSATTWQFL